MTATTKVAERVGQLLKGRYRIDRVLHAGARSTVYAGADLKAGRVAIKVLEGEADASVLRSSYLANAVGHPSAVTVLDSGSTEDGAYFLVMELLEASSMSELLTQHEGRLPVRLACDITDQALELLASAHAQGIVHGQLALDKLFFTRTERLKVLGFSKQASEQAAADDVRALAAVSAWLMCGEPVESLPAGAGAAVPARIASVIERGLSSDPAEQWKSAMAMRTALQLACKAELGRPIDRTLQPMAAKSARKTTRRAWLAAAATLVVGLYVSREIAELGQEQAPETEAETDVAAALQPAQAQAQDEEPAQADELPQASSAQPDEADEASEPEPEAAEAPRALPRKPNRAELRLPVQRKSGLPTNIAPLSQLCAQLSSTRRARPLSDHEAQLYTDRCTKQH